MTGGIRAFIFIMFLTALFLIAGFLNIPKESLTASILDSAVSSASLRGSPQADEAILTSADQTTVEIALVAQPSYQDQLDDIAEKLDIIKQQVAELEAQLNPPEPSLRESPQTYEAIPALVDRTTVEIASLEAPRNDENMPVSTNAGSPAPKIEYPKILFSEIQLSPIDSRFIELYNPNDKDITLTDWYLQRKTATSDSFNSFVSSTKFEGKTILANGYFLISRSNALADIFLGTLTLTKNNSFILKNPDRDISDSLSLAGQNPGEGKSLCRRENSWQMCFPTPSFADSGDYFTDSGDYF